jgi:hypothetical protein
MTLPHPSGCSATSRNAAKQVKVIPKFLFMLILKPFKYALGDIFSRDTKEWKTVFVRPNSDDSRGLNNNVISQAGTNPGAHNRFKDPRTRRVIDKLIDRGSDGGNWSRLIDTANCISTLHEAIVRARTLGVVSENMLKDLSVDRLILKLVLSCADIQLVL